MKTETIPTIEYKITGQQDGSWVVQSYDTSGKHMGARIEVKTPSEAWKVWMVLNGYGFCEIELQKIISNQTEVTEEIDLSKLEGDVA